MSKYNDVLIDAMKRRTGGKLTNDLIANALMERSELIDTLIDPRRDIDAECHYPTTGEITADQLKNMYDRDPIACRVVQCLARQSWQVQPSVYESEDPEVKTPFEEAWDALQPMTNGKSWFKTEEAGTVWEYLERADVLSGIGHFGVLLMGFDDGKNLQEPVDGAMVVNDCYLTKTEEDNLHKLPDINDQEKLALNQLARQREFVLNYMQAQEDKKYPPQEKQQQGTALFGDATGATTMEDDNKQYSQGFGLKGEAEYKPSPMGTDQQYFGVQFGPSEQPSDQPSKRQLKLLFLRPFDESLVQIVRYEWNINNPRFGMPVMYRITLNDPREQHSGIGLPMATVFVHWSRVIHLADNLNSSEIFGTPRCRPVFNRLLDLQKIYGASAEGYWQAAFTGLALETHPQLGGDVTIDSDDVRDQIENYINSLQRYLALTGMSAHTLAPQVSDPSSQIDKHLEAICIQLEIPKRVFMGSERGELASSQDDASWNDRLKARQQGYITPRIIVPFIDRLISVGVLPEPDYVEPIEEPEIEDEFGEEDAFDFEAKYASDEDVAKDFDGEDLVKEDEEESDEQLEEDRSLVGLIKNAFCATGEGGGQDNSCSSSEGGSNESGDSSSDIPEVEELDKALNAGVEKYKFPKILYHVTSGKAVKGIDKSGLKFGHKRATTSGKNRGVYLTDSPEELFGAEDFDPKDIHIVEVDTSKLKLRFDPEFYYGTLQEDTPEELHRSIKDGEAGVFAYSKTSIPRSAIKSIKPARIDKLGWSYKDKQTRNAQQTSINNAIEEEEKNEPPKEKRDLKRYTTIEDEEEEPMVAEGEEEKIEEEDYPLEGDLEQEELEEVDPLLEDDTIEQIGVKTPKGYCVVWPDLESNTDLSKAQIAATKTQAMATYVSGNVESIMPLIHFYTKILGLTDEEAADLVEAAEEQEAAMEREQLEKRMQNPFGGGQPGMPGQQLNVPSQLPFGQEQGQFPLPEEEQGALADLNDKNEEEEKPQFPFDQTENQEELTLHKSGDEGKWITIKGSHVLVKDGEVAKGPEALTKSKPDKSSRVKSSESNIPTIDPASREEWITKITNSPGGKLKLPKSAIDNFMRSGNAENLASELSELKGDDNFVAARRIESAYAEQHGGFDIAKSASLRKVRDNSLKVSSAMSEDQLDSIRQYTTDDYYDLNKSLREGKKLSGDKVHMVTAVNSLVNGVGKWEQPATIYHGVSSSSEASKKAFIDKVQLAIKGNQLWEEKAILSTSASRKMSEDWIRKSAGGGILMRIKANQGALISTFTGLSEQQEILQKPGSKYRPIGITEETGRRGNKITIVDFEQV